LAEGPLGFSQQQIDRVVDRSLSGLGLGGTGGLVQGLLTGAVVAAEVLAGAVLAVVLAFFFVRDGACRAGWWIAFPAPCARRRGFERTRPGPPCATTSEASPSWPWPTPSASDSHCSSSAFLSSFHSWSWSSSGRSFPSSVRRLPAWSPSSWPWWRRVGSPRSSPWLRSCSCSRSRETCSIQSSSGVACGYPAVTLLSFSIGASAAGILGALVAVPLAAMIGSAIKLPVEESTLPEADRVQP